MGPEWVERLSELLAQAGSDPTARVLLLEGGERHFSAGASREALLHTRAQEGITRYTARAPHDLLALPIPVVAAMSGHAIGGGLVLGLWCDVAVLAEESLYGANFMALGFTPGMGATTVLDEVFGASLARELLFTGRCVTGRELKECGVPLAHAIRPRREVRERALDVAREMAEAPREALVLLKRSLAGRRRERLERALTEERENHALLFEGISTHQQIAARYAPSRAACEGGEG